MNRFRFAITLAGSAALMGSVALAGPPLGAGIGGGIGAGIGAGAHAGVPGIGPRTGVPIGVPVSVPVSRPVQPANASAHAQSTANVHAQSTANVHALPLRGTLLAVNGTTVTVRLSTGTVETYAVSAATAQQLRASLEKPLAFTVQNGVLTIAGHQGYPPLHGTLTSLNGNVAAIKLADGATENYTVNSTQAAWLSSHVGKRIVFWSKNDGSIELNQHTTAHSQKH